LAARVGLSLQKFACIFSLGVVRFLVPMVSSRESIVHTIGNESD
jgi:hypothetical protein